jgi:hypothetical protein
LVSLLASELALSAWGPLAGTEVPDAPAQGAIKMLFIRDAPKAGLFFSKDRKIKSGWFDAKIMGLLNTPQDAELIGIQAPRNLLIVSIHLTSFPAGTCL